ncbi:MAG: hypothetical protein DRG09_06915 [Epsilonproteobacteria bacterium]|nr:MAG: hypothetical protein DRG09_06915 [Campylobacterota bacterium]
MATLPTMQDLFGGLPEALAYYKSLFDVPADDLEIEALLDTAFLKIDPVFGEFRNYVVGENTVRNEHVKRAVCFEANTIYKYSLVSVGVVHGINTGEKPTGDIVSEKMEDVSTTYSDKDQAKGIGLGDSGLMSVLGLLSYDASILLSRYIRKTYGMGFSCTVGTDVNTFGTVL